MTARDAMRGGNLMAGVWFGIGRWQQLVALQCGMKDNARVL